MSYILYHGSDVCNKMLYYIYLHNCQRHVLSMGSRNCWLIIWCHLIGFMLYVCGIFLSLRNNNSRDFRTVLFGSVLVLKKLIVFDSIIVSMPDKSSILFYVKSLYPTYSNHSIWSSLLISYKVISVCICSSRMICLIVKGFL